MTAETLNTSLSLYLSANPAIILLLIWIIVWKALALWTSARRGQKIWFIALLIVNTMGILEIIYLSYSYFKDKKKNISEKL
jgi:hypothetical protein